MSRPANDPLRLGLLVCFTLGLALASRPIPVPPDIKALAGVALVFLLPGLALAMALFPRERNLFKGLAFAFPLSFVPLGLSTAVGLFLGWPPLMVACLTLLQTFLLLFVALVTGPKEPLPSSRPRFLIAILGGAVLLLGWIGAPVTATSDGSDHLTTIRETVTSSQLIPKQGLLADGEMDRSDPRKGLGHLGLASVSALTKVDPSLVWRWAPSVVSLSWLCLVFFLAQSFGLTEKTALLVTLLTLLFLEGGGSRVFYGSYLSWVLGWCVLWTWLEGWERTRFLIALSLALVSPFVHPLAPGFFLPALFVGLVFDKQRDMGRVGQFLALGLACLPGLVLRVIESRGPLNPLHEQPMATFGVFGSTVLWPGDLIAQVGGLGLLSIFLLRFALGPRPWSKSHVLLLSLVVLPLLATCVPFLFPSLVKVSSSFPIKFLAMIPTLWILGLLWERLRIPLRVVLAVFVLGLGLGSLQQWHTPHRAQVTSTEHALLGSLRAIGGQIVVASDPWFSQLLASQTNHYPITVFHQHGHPLDSQGLQRLNDLSAILSPWVSLAETERMLQKYRASAVVLTGTEPEENDFGFSRGGELANLRQQKFSQARGFEVIRAGEGAVYRRIPNRELEPTRPPLPLRVGAAEGLRLSSQDGECEGIRLQSIAFPPQATKGKMVSFRLWWQAQAPTGWPVEVHLRLDREDGPSKIRRNFERLLGTKSPLKTWRWVKPPMLGGLPTTHWPLRQSFQDELQLYVPEQLEAGVYQVRARVLPRPMFTKVHWRDLVSNQDQWHGEILGTLEVTK